MEAVMTLNCDLLIDLLSESSQQPRLSQELDVAVNNSIFQLLLMYLASFTFSSLPLLSELPAHMRNVFFIATDSFIKNSTSGTQGSRMVYLLRNLGAQINAQNEHGNTALMCYLKHDKPDCSIVEAFLRCNADIYIVNKHGEFPLELVTTCPRLSGSVRDVFLRYVPGIWEAVARDDAVTIRRLINAWCRVDVQKNGKTLLQLAMEHGTENIIRVISSIRPSMEFAHCVLAGDTQMVRRVLRQKLKININFRNLGDHGKTPIFYALEQGNTDMVHTLLDRGARVDITIKGDHEVDIPLYFAALEHHPAISSDLLKAVTPVAPVKIDALFYKGRNILFHCIEKCVGDELVEFILSKSSAYLVTQRVELNRCPRELAEEAGCRWMVQAIDAAVVRWVYQEDSLNRQILILQGYQYISSALQSHNHRESMPDTFYRYLPLYQEQVRAVHKAVEECDEETVRHIIYFRHPDDHSLDPCLADCRRPGDGQPLLHKAVLRGSVGVVQLLAETLVYQRKQRLDSVRDQCFRTALHYAYGLEDGRDLVNLLLDYGASEFSVDKDNRNPLAFKEKRGQDSMNALLEYHYMQDFSYQEPDVWSVESQMPMFDYLLSSSCSHSDGQPYVTSQGLKHFTGHISSGHLSALPNTALTVPEALNQCTAFTMSHRCRSASDTKLHKITASKQGLAANLANFPDLVKSRLSKKHNSKSNVQVVHKDYLPIPLDAPRESEDDYDYMDDITDSKDLLDEKEMRKSTSCSLQ